MHCETYNKPYTNYLQHNQETVVPTEMTRHIPGHLEGRTSSHRTREEHGTFWPHTLWSRRKHLSQLTREAEDKIDLAVN